MKLCKEHNYPLHVTGNMDKTPLIFDMPPNRMINITPQKRKLMSRNCLLARAADGSKLRPMVIFKRKTVPKVENKHRVISDAQEKDRMDAEGMKSLACSTCWDWGDEEACLFMLSKLM